MAAPNQTDFYKGIFLETILKKSNQFTLSVFNQDNPPSISGVNINDWYSNLNDLANDFANAFTSAVTNSSTINVTPTIGQTIIPVAFADVYFKANYQVFITANSQAGATALVGGFFIQNKTTSGFDIVLSVPIAAVTPFVLDYSIS